MTTQGTAQRAVAMALGLRMVTACDAETTGAIDQARANDARDGGEHAGDGDSDGTEPARLDGGDAAANRGPAGSGGAAGMDASSGIDGSSGAEGEGTAGVGAPAGTLVAPSAPAGVVVPPPPPEVTTWDPEDCHVPPVEEPSDPSLHERWEVTRDYCRALEEQGCLLGIYEEPSEISLEECSPDQQVDACIGDMLRAYPGTILPECDAAWRDAVACGTSALSEGACPWNVFDPYGPAGTCGPENDILLECVLEYDDRESVEGSYTTCSYGPGYTGECAVYCRGLDHLTDLHCFGADGVPMQCECSINGHPFNALSTLDGWVKPIFVSDCEDAATQAADGLCANRVDCCFEYFDGSNQICHCGPHPEPLGFDSCEELASYADGQVVDICPQWADPPPSCWPPDELPCDPFD